MNSGNSQNSASPNGQRKEMGIAGTENIPSRRQVIKNLVVICIGFILLFTAYNGLSMLQSTMNQNGGIGVASQAIIYAGFCISALMLPKYTIKKLGCKRALLVSMSCYIPYIASNFYFNWLTVTPSAILVGLAASVLWSSSCTYFNESAERYSNLCIHDTNFKAGVAKTNCCTDAKNEVNSSSVEDQELSLKPTTLDCKTLQSLDTNHELKYSEHNTLSTLHSNNDIDSVKETCLIKDSCVSVSLSDKYQSEINCTNSKDSHNPCINTLKGIPIKESQINPNSQEEHSKIVSSVTARFFGVAGMGYRTSDIWSNLLSYYILQNNTVHDNVTENGNCSCGASFCNVESNCFENNLAEPSPQMRNMLTGISVILAFLAVILIFLFLDELETDRKPVKFSFSLAFATCKFSCKKEALLLLPLSAYIGFQQGFYIGDFTKSYIACAWGVYHVGLVSVAYGITSGISSTVAGILVKYVGRIPVILGGGVINAGICIYLLIWNPLPSQPTRFFISAAFWGMAVGILWSQLRAFYGVVFKDDMEAAFAGFYLWDSIGYCIAFSYSNYICTYIKIYILLAVSTLGIIGYVRTESIFNQRKSESNG